MRTSDRLRAIANELCELADDLDIEFKAGFRKLEDLEWSVRCRNVFRAEGIETLAQLARRTEIDLMSVPNIGRKSLREIKENLAELGLQLRREPWQND